ncbi:MAG: TRAP transporter large permease subunit [Bradyrhizobium sp.]
MLDVLIYLVLPAVLLVLGLPIFLTLFVTCIVILLVAGLPTGGIQIYMFGSLDNFPLLAIPFFVLAGEIMAQGGVARRIVVWVISVIGGVPGSLAVTTVAASELFGAMTHTAVGTVVAVGRMTYPSLREGGYDERFAAGLIASSGAIAVVIPPSIAMIIYSMVAQQSAIALFTAGILPSLLIGLVDALYVMAYARFKGVPSNPRTNWAAIWASTRDASWSLGTIIVIFGGIYGGIFTPTEAAGVAVIYSLFVTMVVHREVNFADLWRIITSAVGLIAQIMIIVTAAGIYASLLTTSGHPAADRRQHQRAPSAGLGDVAVPERDPAGDGKLSRAAGRNPDPDASPAPDRPGCRRTSHSLRIIMAVNLSIGMYTPPFGLNLFASQAVFETPLGTVYRGVLPFVLLNFVTLLVITYVPAISTAFLAP